MPCLFFRNHFRYVIYQATSNVCFYSQIWQIETIIQVLDIAKQVKTYIWRPFWTPSWISQNAQWCQGGISQILEGQCLGYKNQSRKKVWTLFPGPDKIPHKSAGLVSLDPAILIGQCDLFSWFSDFALCLGNQLVYEHTSFTIWVRPLNLR